MTTFRPILEAPSEYEEAGRLGRHVEHDPRSRQYAFPTGNISVAPVRHTRHVPIFDQGDIGSCTGQAAVGVLATDPFWDTIETDSAHHMNEDLAVAFYAAATASDEYEGTYPPDDTGSTGLAIAKVLQLNKFISGYLHTFTFADMLKALTVTPVLVGMNWYSTFDNPDVHGAAKIGPRAYVRGGHEVYADEITDNDYVGFTNSWTEHWGLGGRFYLPFKDVERLLDEEGDVTVLVPITHVAPVPMDPPHDPGPDDHLWDAVLAWAKTKGLA